MDGEYLGWKNVGMVLAGAKGRPHDGNGAGTREVLECGGECVVDSGVLGTEGQRRRNGGRQVESKGRPSGLCDLLRLAFVEDRRCLTIDDFLTVHGELQGSRARAVHGDLDPSLRS